MRIPAKLTTSALAIASLMALSACASQAPRITNPSLGYAVTNYEIDADQDEQALSSALDAALPTIGMAGAMPMRADIEIQNVRYDSVILGIFYGGQHYARLEVTLTDSAGRKVANFPLYVAANGSRRLADADLAASVANIIAAKAANAFMPVQMITKAAAKPTPIAEMPAGPVPTPAPVDLVQPTVDVPALDADSTTPCVIGPEGKCLPL